MSHPETQNDKKGKRMQCIFLLPGGDQVSGYDPFVSDVQDNYTAKYSMEIHILQGI